MSINSAMLAGVSGLTANSAALAAISQNIANVNTVGYKRSQAEFQTVINGQNQGAGYSAGGVMASARHYVSDNGQLQRTTSATDLGISGRGFFVVTDKAEGVQVTDTRLFTRAGAFQVDDLGYLKNSAGLYLQGWPADSDGNVATDPSDLNRLRSINIGTVGGTAEATTRAQINANLSSGQEISAAVGTYDPATNSMAMWTPEGTAGVKPDFELSIPVSDSKGGQRSVTVAFLKDAEPNQWHVEIIGGPGEIEGAGPDERAVIRSGLLAFTQDGRLDAAGTAALGENALFTDPANAAVTFGGSRLPPPATPPTGDAIWAEHLGISGQTISLDFMASAGGLTQYDSDSVVQAVLTNGTPFGNLSNIEIDEQGYVTAIFDNGVTRRIAQVALATFPSPDSLKSVNGNAYAVTQGSGTYNLKAPGTGGAGEIGASQLEASTVDLSAEFTGLITTQRAYSASSKIITTADEMMEELLRIKR